MNIGIYIYDQAEVLDFAGPFEVFSTASRLSESSSLFNVFLVGEKKEPVTARGGFRVNPAFGFHDDLHIDVLIVAGGVHTEEIKKTNVLQWLAHEASKTKLVASVCTGAFLLAQAGVLKNHNVTTHWEDIPDLQKKYENLYVHKNKRWVDEGNIITSAGISAGIDMSLHIVSRLHSSELAERTAKQMEFDWTKNL